MTAYPASAVAIENRAVLLEGPSGSGKSDLSFRLLALGAKLISDDYVNLAARGKKLLASPPENIAGKLEIRGVGIKTFPYEKNVPVDLLISLVPRKKVERLPEAEMVSLKGIKVKKARLHAFDASAPEKILLLLDKN